MVPHRTFARSAAVGSPGYGGRAKFCIEIPSQLVFGESSCLHRAPATCIRDRLRESRVSLDTINLGKKHLATHGSMQKSKRGRCCQMATTPEVCFQKRSSASLRTLGVSIDTVDRAVRPWELFERSKTEKMPHRCSAIALALVSNLVILSHRRLSPPGMVSVGHEKCTGGLARCIGAAKRGWR